MFLATKLLDKNFSCFIGDKIGISRALKYFGPGTYFHKSINFFDNKRIVDIKNKGNFYVSLDEEGGYQLRDELELKKFLNIRTSLENVKNVDIIFNWGKFDNNVCKKIYPKFKRKFIVSGSPRVDLWKSKILKIIYSREIKKIEKIYNKKFILVISSNISSIKNVKRIFSIAYKNYIFRNLREKKEAFNDIYQELNDFKKFSKLMIQIIKNNPSEFFVLRPHPAEEYSAWENLIKRNKLKNVLLNNQFDPTPWIYKSDCIIQSKSSLAIEASVLKKSIISINLNNKRRIFPNKFGKILKTKTDVNKYLSNKRKLNEKILDKKNLSFRIFNSDQKYSSSKIISNKINKLYKKNIQLSFFKVLFFSILFKIYDNIKEYFEKKNKINKIMKRKMGNGIFKNEILEFIKLLSKDSKFIVIQIAKNTFYIRKSKL